MLAMIGIIGFVVCVARAIADAFWKRDETVLEYVLGIQHSAIYRITGKQVAILFVLTALVAGLGTAIVLLIVASIFTRED